MKVSDFIGKKVLDKNALEIGKVSDMDIDPLEGLINTITISKGELSLKQKVFVISVDELDKVGDYVVITLASEEAGYDGDKSESENVSITTEKSE
jgi:sporulation protein YlmC with PRC-barrel domain